MSRRDEIEDGMGFSGLVPSRAEREQDAMLRGIRKLEAKCAFQAEMLERAVKIDQMKPDRHRNRAQDEWFDDYCDGLERHKK